MKLISHSKLSNVYDNDNIVISYLKLNRVCDNNSINAMRLIQRIHFVITISSRDEDVEYFQYNIAIKLLNRKIDVRINDKLKIINI